MRLKLDFAFHTVNFGNVRGKLKGDRQTKFKVFVNNLLSTINEYKCSDDTKTTEAKYLIRMCESMHLYDDVYLIDEDLTENKIIFHFKTIYKEKRAIYENEEKQQSQTNQ